MPDFQPCLSIHDRLEAIERLKRKFAVAYADAVVSDKNDDLVEVRKLKHDIVEQTRALNDELIVNAAEKILGKENVHFRILCPVILDT